jgi:NADH-quinone oxidoreductase subunit I
MIGIKPIDRAPLRWHERLYVGAVATGLARTMRHLWRYLRGHRPVPTVSYPEVREPAPLGLRGRHRLMQRPDGAPKCVACMCCPTICPADCIHIVADESPDPTIEKRPIQFTIDYMRCVFCGLCVEACPVDAIRMDTGEIVLADYTREAFIFDMERLLRSEPGAPPPAGQAACGGFEGRADVPQPPTGPYYPSEFLERRAALGHATDPFGTRLATAGEKPRAAAPAPPPERG